VLKQGISNTISCRPAPRAATPRPRARAPSASAPEATPGEVARRPRPCLPHAPTPLGSLESSRAARRHFPRRTGRAHATDRRSVGGVSPYARRSRPPDHGSFFAVTPSSSLAEFPYLTPRPTLARTTSATAAAMTAA
jgi:hypothetical protein